MRRDSGDGILIGMADRTGAAGLLPEPKGKPQELSPQEEAFQEGVVMLMERGLTPGQIAKRLAPKDKVERKRLRNRLRNLIYRDATMQARLAESVKGQMLIGLAAGGVQGMVRRMIETGRHNEVKLALEATGIHNPHVSHDHSGEITVKVDMPRPKKVEAEDEQVVDAEVVDE